MLKSRGIWVRENTELLEHYSKYFNVHAVATLKKGKKHLTEMKNVEGCDFMPEAIYFEVTEANSIKIALFLACENQTKSHGKGKSKRV